MPGSWLVPDGPTLGLSIRSHVASMHVFKAVFVAGSLMPRNRFLGGPGRAALRQT